jgi:hypothetical protein
MAMPGRTAADDVEKLGLGDGFVWDGAAWRDVPSLLRDIQGFGGFNSTIADNGWNEEVPVADAAALSQDMADKQLAGLIGSVMSKMRAAAETDGLSWSSDGPAAHAMWSSVIGNMVYFQYDLDGDARADRILSFDTSTMTLRTVLDQRSAVEMIQVSSVAFGANDGELSAGEAVTVVVEFSAPVTLAEGTPALALSNGGVASYVSGAGSNQLVFSYVPGAGEDTSDLGIVGLVANGARITGVSGTAADVSGLAVNPAGELVVDTTVRAPGVALTVDSGIAGDGITNAAALTITGAEAGAAVQYSADGGTSWNSGFTPVEGLNTVLVRQVDVAGNVSAATSFAFTLDTAAQAPVITSFSDGTDVLGDGKTSDTNLLISGTAEPFATVTLTGAVATLTTTVAADGSWSVQTGEMGFGSRSFTATITDLAGNVSPVSTPMSVSIIADLTTLAPSQGFIIQGDAAGDLAGFSVSSAGDVNGDGFEDVIVGAGFGDDGGLDAGEAYVIFGSAAGPGMLDATGRKLIDLTSLTPEQGFVIQGDSASDGIGTTVSYAGDVNGDGFDDMIFGAPWGNDGGSDAGEAYVIFGSASGFGSVDGTGRRVIDLTSLSAAQGFIIQGDVANDWAGVRVSSAGDMNGDGFADLVVGARYGDDGGTNAGEAYVLFGTASGFGAAVTAGGFTRQVIDLTTLTSAQGFIIQGDVAGDDLGFGVSAAGDVNGDGFDDIVIGAPQGDDGGSNAGEAYVIFGSDAGFGATVTGRQVIDLTSLTSTQGFIIQGDVAADKAGWWVSGAGDINGDGIADLLVGARYGDDGGTDAGETYVVFGSTTGFGTPDGAGRLVIDLTTLTPAQGFVIQADAAGDALGHSVAAAGDINGDGFDDLIAGSPYGDDAGADAGEAYLIFGSGSGFGAMDSSGRQVLDLTSLSASQGFIIQGNAAGDTAGNRPAGAGDINGDGFDDLIVGARRADGGGLDAGEAYVIYGGAFGKTVLTAGTAAAEILIGSTGNDTLTGGGGSDVLRGGAGNDVLAVADTGFIRIDGGTGTDTLRLDGAGLSLNLTAAAPDRIESIERIDLTGSGNNTLTLDRLTVNQLTEERSGGTAILMVNGNAGDSVTLADPGWWSMGGIVTGGISYERYANAFSEVRVQTGVTVTAPGPFYDLTFLTPSLGFIIQGDTGSDWAGRVAAAGDVNGDGFDDMIIGAPLGDDGGNWDAGEAYVVFGSASGFGTVDPTGRRVIDLTSLTAAQGFIIQGDVAGDQAAWFVSAAGDVNGDGFDDVLVGAPRGDDGGADAGEAYVVFGSGSSFGTSVTTGGFPRQVVDLTALTAAQGFIIQGDVAGDFLGNDVSPAGDINGDGYDDLFVGANLGDDGGTDAGESYVIFGSGSSFGTLVGSRRVIDLTTLTASQGFIIQGNATGDMASRVRSAGDINGDGFEDLIVGAGSGDDGGTDAGEAYVVFGTAAGFGALDGTGRPVIDLTFLTSSQGFIIQGDMAGDGAGGSVSSAGDINGDGFDDLIIGAGGGDDGGTNAGEAYVVFGSNTGFGVLDATGRQVIDLTALTPAQGFIIQGDVAGDGTGSVSSAGDVNGDGFDDLIIGASTADSSGVDAGKAYVVFGSASGFGVVDATGRSVLDLSALTTAQGFIIQGDSAGDVAGVSVSGAGDVNGDGFDDLMVGARFGDDGGGNAGEGYVVFGRAFGRTVVTTGTAAAELLIGSTGNDTLTGGGGADALRGGAGNDILAVSDTAFREIDGGTGYDTLRLAGAGINLQLDSRIDGIEIFDIAGSGANALQIEARDVLTADYDRLFYFTAATAPTRIVVEGGADDDVILFDLDPDGAGPLPDSHTWQLAVSDVGLDGSAGGAYDIWKLNTGGTVAATLAIDADIEVSVIT